MSINFVSGASRESLELRIRGTFVSPFQRFFSTFSVSTMADASDSETESALTGSAGDRAEAGAQHARASSSSSSSCSSCSSSSSSSSDHSLSDEVDLTGLLQGLALGKARGARRSRQGALLCLSVSPFQLPFFTRLTGSALIHVACSPTEIASLIREATNIVVAAGAGRSAS